MICKSGELWSSEPNCKPIELMVKRNIPCVLMRSGTSRGPFFLREWLPENDTERDQALIGAIGASDPLQLDGLGGGSTLNCKVAIVSLSKKSGCDLDYLFAQVGVGHQSVDTRPNCGNMLAGVAPFAIEQGLIQAQEAPPPFAFTTLTPAPPLNLRFAHPTVKSPMRVTRESMVWQAVRPPSF